MGRLGFVQCGLGQLQFWIPALLSLVFVCAIGEIESVG